MEIEKALLAQGLRRPTVNRKIKGSIPLRSDLRYYTALIYLN